MSFWDWDDGRDVAAITPAHNEFRAKVRAVYEMHVIPFVDEWEEVGSIPKGTSAKLYDAGVYGLGWPAEYGGTPPANLDPWHEFILSDEMGRVAAGGVFASLFTLGIGLPPILAVGSQEVKDKVARDVITGRKAICLSITEPGGGSDVANIRTTAVKEGDVYIVNGGKTFISGGIDADYFTTAVRTGDEGKSGVSLLLIERNFPGVRTTRLPTQGWHCSTTTTVSFDDVKVPCRNLIGVEGEGFLPIMRNFTTERRGMAIMANRFSRICLEDALDYARKRKTFGRPLISHQVIRHKAADMARAILSTYGMICNVNNLMFLDPYDAALHGYSALLKVQATKSFEFCAREASQILGGKSYLRQGPGRRIERLYREVRVFAIGGGSEEILLDLAGRQAKL